MCPASQPTSSTATALTLAQTQLLQPPELSSQQLEGLLSLTGLSDNLSSGHSCTLSPASSVSVQDLDVSLNTSCLSQAATPHMPQGCCLRL